MVKTIRSLGPMSKRSMGCHIRMDPTPYLPAIVPILMMENPMDSDSNGKSARFPPSHCLHWIWRLIIMTTMTINMSTTIWVRLSTPTYITRHEATDANVDTIGNTITWILPTLTMMMMTHYQRIVDLRRYENSFKGFVPNLKVLPKNSFNMGQCRSDETIASDMVWWIFSYSSPSRSMVIWWGIPNQHPFQVLFTWAAHLLEGGITSIGSQYHGWWCRNSL